MKKAFIISLILWALLFILAQADEDPYASFGKIPKSIGIVINSTAYGAGTYTTITSILDSCGITNLLIIDHSNIDNPTYDGTHDWSSLDLVIIEEMGATAGDYSPDTSSAGGLKAVNVIILEDSYWDEFGLPKSTGTYTNDSLKIGYVNSAFHITKIWKANQLFNVASSGMSMAKFDGTSLGASNILLYAVNSADTICAYDTLNSKKRMALGINMPASWSAGNRSLWTFFNRSISLMSNNLNDSLTTGLFINQLLSTSSDAGRSALRTMTNLEINGHDVYFPSPTDFDSAYVNFNSNGTDSLAWSQIQFCLYGGINAYDSTRFDSLVSHVNKIGIIGTRESNTTDLVSKIHIAVKIDTAGTPSGNNIDSLIVSDAGHPAFDGYYSSSQKFRIGRQKRKQLKYESVFSGTTVIAKDYSYLTTPDTALIVVRNDKKRWAFPYLSGPQATYTGSTQSPGDSLWAVFGRLMGWMFSEAAPLAPSNISLTDVDIDSFTLSFTDNSEGVAAHAIKILYPYTGIYGTLSAGTTTGSIYYFWPPGQRVIIDIGAIDTPDTLWSDDPDTAVSRVVMPPKTEFYSLSDTSAKFMINGFLLLDTFSDGSVTSGEVAWTADMGSWHIPSPLKQLRISTDGGTNRIRASYAADSASHGLDDTIFTLNFRMADSLYKMTQFVEFHFMNMKSSLDSNGYYVRVDSPNVRLYRNDDGTGTSIINSTWTPDSKWHRIKVLRDRGKTPAADTMTFRLYYDDALVNSTTSTTYKKMTHWGIKASDVGMYFDNISIQRERPSGNHINAQYAVQDSMRAKYVNHTTKLLQTLEDWKTYTTWNLALGDTVIISNPTPPDTLRMRSKARNVWQ